MNVAELYHSRVRDMISQKYREVSKERQDLIHRQHDLLRTLEDETIPYKEYVDLSRELDSVREEIKFLNVAINVWDEARELCFQAAEDFKD